MAAISPISGPSAFRTLRSGATTSQTDWIDTPHWATKAIVTLSVTTAGTSTIPTFHAADPVLRDDAQAMALFAGATITAASNHFYLLGDYPKVAEVADGAAADAIVLQDELVMIPALLGIQIVATGSTYTLSIHFKK